MLNGWQRLWVILVVFSAGICAFNVYDSYQSRPLSPGSTYADKSMREAKLRELAQLAKEEGDKETQIVALRELLSLLRSQNNEENPNSEKGSYGSDLPDLPDGFVLVPSEDAAESFLKDLEVEGEEARKTHNLSLLKSALLHWIVFSVGLYASGWSIGWVYRGFKSNS